MLETNPSAPPQLLSDFESLRSKPVVQGRIISYPRYWQVPAATEKTAYDALSVHADTLGFVYIGFPWATVIDGVRRETVTLDELMRALVAIRALQFEGPDIPRATVAQHINADRFIEIFSACGVTDLFWSHAQRSHTQMGGITVHPFPLFPAQTADKTEHDDLHRPRQYLANFIGAYNPKAYLTDVREHIFRDAGTAADLLIVKRDTWHFERAVYAEQMRGIAPDDARLSLEALYKDEYLQAIRDSVFTLCPTGSGPNSIRIGESLALGSIPIILTRDLALPGDPALWEAACVFAEDSANGYRQSLDRARAMSESEIRTRQRNTQNLFAQIGPLSYSALILSAMGKNESAASHARLHSGSDESSAASVLQ
jgi:hypothetical protein